MSAAGVRLDKWLWYARFYKTRSLAARLCESERIRVNNVVVGKAHYLVRPGDVLTFIWNERVRVVEVIALGSRRGPAREARALYTDLGSDLGSGDGSGDGASATGELADAVSPPRLAGGGDEGC